MEETEADSETLAVRLILNGHIGSRFSFRFISLSEQTLEEAFNECKAILRDVLCQLNSQIISESLLTLFICFSFVIYVSMFQFLKHMLILLVLVRICT